ncbi:MAG: hypothetical protein U9N72_07385 [Bacteroidota bacterium]|nr:hypothetical protein [Bacteroidota bacterium]
MKKYLPFKSILLLILPALLFYCLPAQAQEETLPDTLTIKQGEITGLFESEDVIDISIKFDITEYMRKKPDEYMDAVITFYNSPDDSVSYDIRLRTRGERRRQVCAFPPIRLNFKNTSTIYGDIDSMTNVKMVTHCNLASAYDEYLLKEYMLYKMYNIVTDYSYRVRLLRIKYIGTGKRERFYSKFGFLIEPMDLLEQRLNAFEIENVHLKYDNLQDDIFDRMAVFQYMIGNTDWQVSTYHNIKILKKRAQVKGVPIPYDFDYSGFVNASYAIPHESFPIKDVRERYFMGACRPDTTYERIINEFIVNKDKFYAVKDKCELLDERTARRVNDYLDGFFRLCERGAVANIFSRECKDR